MQPNCKLKSCFLLTLALSFISVHSAGILKELECHDKVVRHGVETLVFPKEVESLFGATNVDHFISNFGSQKPSPIWNSVAYFSGRYTFALQVPISIDYQNCKLNRATGVVFIQINETTKVDVSKSGIAAATEKGQWRLNGEEWKRFVTNKGDWTVVKIPILTNAPVKGFDEFVRQVREPIRNRKEGFDMPVQKAIDGLRKGTTGTDQKQEKKQK